MGRWPQCQAWSYEAAKGMAAKWGSTLKDMSTGEDFLNGTQEIQPAADKQNLKILESFFTIKEIANPIKSGLQNGRQSVPASPLTEDHYLEYAKHQESEQPY